MKREQKKNIENFEKVIEEKKKLPKSERDKINAKAFENLIIIAIIIIYLISLYFGMTNSPTDMYITDLRVFSIMLLMTTIIILEYAYKKDKRRSLDTWNRSYDYCNTYFISYIYVFTILLDIWNHNTFYCNYLFDLLCSKTNNNTKKYQKELSKKPY